METWKSGNVEHRKSGSGNMEHGQVEKWKRESGTCESERVDKCKWDMENWNSIKVKVETEKWRSGKVNVEHEKVEQSTCSTVPRCSFPYVENENVETCKSGEIET